MSSLNLAAIALYALTVFACATAAFVARKKGQPAPHLWTWVLLSVFFIGIAAMRWFEVEDMLMSYFRSNLRAEGTYQQRRDFQRPLVSALIIIGGAIAFALVYVAATKVAGRRNLARAFGVGAGFAMAGLGLIRVASLSPVDRLLYGPLKLNWIIDIGSSLVAALAAIAYILLVLRNPNPPMPVREEPRLRPRSFNAPRR
ncbi:MAG: hypothetical protein AAFR02_12830 [Pseudomonadota bacterium]